MMLLNVKIESKRYSLWIIMEVMGAITFMDKFNPKNNLR